MANKIVARRYKGTRDFLPDQMVRRNYVINIIKRIFERYGFEPLETPTLELWETLSGKYGDEGDQLSYHFTHGKTEVGLRYDLTVPLSRVCAMHPNLPKPFRRYQIQPVWRGDRPQKGRFREFYQCDIDIVGSPSVLADAELICITDEVLQSLNFQKYTIRVNSRKVLAGLVDASGAGMENETQVYRAIDKLDKIGLDGVIKELIDRGIPSESVSFLQGVLQLEGNNAERLNEIASLFENSEPGSEGLAEIHQLFQYLQDYGVSEQSVLFDVCLARGLTYYTGPIFETVVEEPRIGSITGGGRYDNLIGMFSGQGFPATGTSIGLERIITVMDELNMFPEDIATSTQVLVGMFDHESPGYSIRIAQSLRAAGINTDIYTGKSKLRGQFGLANDKRIPLTLLAGPDEEENKQVTVKDMRTGEQQLVALVDLVETVNNLLR